ncbi:MAG: PmbA/TldD protein [bacterium 42_11]|nr:MAG: PmbA/TldD protein [bacterium 42_11]
MSFLDYKELALKAIDNLYNLGDLSDVFIEISSGESIKIEDDKLEYSAFGMKKGMGLRVVKGEGNYYFHGLPDVKFLEEGIKALREALREERPGRFVSRSLLTGGSSCLKREPLQGMVELLWKLNEFFRKNELVRQVVLSYRRSHQDVWVGNDEGGLVNDKRIYTFLTMGVVVEKDGRLETGYEVIGGTKGDEVLEERDPFEVAEKVLKRALLTLSADPAPAGMMDVVIAGEAGGTMIHEACGHGLEADIVRKESSVYAEKIGQEVASPLVTLVDDGTIPGLGGSISFDDEGVPAQRTVLIEKGVLKGYLTDRLSSKLMGLPLTGNGRREGFKDFPIPRMTNTFLEPGEHSFDEILSSVERGLLVLKMGGGEVNPTDGNFVFKVTEGYLIEKGKIGKPVRGALLIGNGPQVLRNIKMLGRDLNFDVGLCGKDGQSVPVGDGQPTMLVGGLVIGGEG